MVGWRWIYEENGEEEEVRKGGRMVEGEGKVKADGVRRHRRLWPPPSPMAAAWGRGTKKKKAERGEGNEEGK